MKPRERAERDALTRMRAALLDLMQAERFTEANDVLAIIERIDPPHRGEAAVSAARSDPGAVVPSATSGPATYATVAGYDQECSNCGRMIAAHCTTHLLPCCPGSLQHGQDEGTWTPSAPSL